MLSVKCQCAMWRNFIIPCIACHKNSNASYQGKDGKHFSTNHPLRRRINHYDVLGLSPKSTQADIKAAYYRLSKIYHPDKNEGSDEAAQKFRSIAEAYEVLGNFRLRRLYDKGQILFLIDANVKFSFVLF